MALISGKFAGREVETADATEWAGNVCECARDVRFVAITEKCTVTIVRRWGCSGRCASDTSSAGWAMRRSERGRPPNVPDRDGWTEFFCVLVQRRASPLDGPNVKSIDLLLQSINYLDYINLDGVSGMNAVRSE